MAPSKSKTWVFTINNPALSPDGPMFAHWRTSPEAKKLMDLEFQMMMIGYEIGEAGTPHLQGYVVFKYNKTFTAMKAINGRARWDRAKYAECAANYCIKDDNYEKIDYRKQGVRTDIRAAVDTLRAHGLKRVKQDHPIEFLKYPSGFAALDVLNENERYFKPDVLWLWGKTGTGKSHFARNVYPACERWWSGRNLRWWQGYRGEDIAIIDDFRKDFCTFHELLRILDCYPYKVEVKGSHRELNSKLIIITTIEPPMLMYADLQGERLDQLSRRITKVVNAVKIGSEWQLWPDLALNRPYLYEAELTQGPDKEGQAPSDGGVLAAAQQGPPPRRNDQTTTPIPSMPDEDLLIWSSENEGDPPPEGDTANGDFEAFMESVVEREAAEQDGIAEEAEC